MIEFQPLRTRGRYLEEPNDRVSDGHYMLQMIFALNPKPLNPETLNPKPYLGTWTLQGVSVSTAKTLPIKHLPSQSPTARENP